MPQRSGLRLFFALWPAPALRAELAALAARLRTDCGGRAPPPANLHLTLAFIGSVAASRLPALKDIAATIVAPPFDLTLDRIGCWRAQRLVWAAPQQCPPELYSLAQALSEGLRARGFAVERRAFKPHVTLLRDIAAPPPQSDCRVLLWPARSVVLACSEPAPRGVRYRVVGEWPFAGA